MKKLLAVIIAVLTVLTCALVCACTPGEYSIVYKPSEGGDYFILSGVSGDKRGLYECDVPAVYTDEEGRQLPVKEIGEGAFYQTKLREVTIPEGIEIIGNLAFATCYINEITIPESVTQIGWSAFGMCDGLEEVTIPYGVTLLDNRAFYCCTNLKKAVIKARITEIKEFTFYNSIAQQGGNVYTKTELKEVWLPSTLQKIHYTAFEGNFIEHIYFEGTKEQWEEVYFYDRQLKEGSDKEYEEVKVEKSKILPVDCEVHYNCEF